MRSGRFLLGHRNLGPKWTRPFPGSSAQVLLRIKNGMGMGRKEENNWTDTESEPECRNLDGNQLGILRVNGLCARGGDTTLHLLVYGKERAIESVCVCLRERKRSWDLVQLRVVAGWAKTATYPRVWQNAPAVLAPFRWLPHWCESIVWRKGVWLHCSGKLVAFIFAAVSSSTATAWVCKGPDGMGRSLFDY